MHYGVLVMETKLVKLSDVAIINPRLRLKKNEVARKIPMEALTPFQKNIDSYSFEKYSGGVKFQNGDTLVARITPSLENGKTSYVDILDADEVAFGSTEFIVLRANKSVLNEEYLYYIATSNNFRQVAIQSMTGTSGRQRVQNEAVSNYELELPSLDIQRQIVQILDAVDSKIELNQQINKNLLKLSSNIVMAASLKSERITDLQTLLDSSRKANISIDEVSLDTYVSNTSLRANKRGLDTAEDYPSVKTVRAVEPGDVLVGNIRPYFKKIWFADRKGGASNDVITFRADNTTVTPEFLFGILYSDRFFDYVTATSKGTKMPRGDKQAIALYQVGLPDKDVITSVSDVVNPMLEQVSLNEKQNQQLTKLRNLLLPKLLAGDIDLSNIETVMNNA